MTWTTGWFEEFMVLLSKVSPGSIVKISVRCEPQDYFDKNDAEATQKKEQFKKTFEEFLPHPTDEPPNSFDSFAKLILNMLQIASQRALSSTSPLKFVPLSSFHYADGAGMFTLTGIVCLRSQEAIVRAQFKNWYLANMTWDLPKRIDVPTLSTKERLHLQGRLPKKRNAGRMLRNRLGYLIDVDIERTETKLQHYADFHRYFPYFMRATP